MKKVGGGAIVNVSNISAFQAQPNRWTYNSAKGAVHTLTRNAALDLAPDGIRVNSVWFCPRILVQKKREDFRF